jgi:hypothetical protein
MPALVAGIHAFFEFAKQDVDARHKAGHDGGEVRRGHDSGEASTHHSSSPGIKPPFVMAGLVPAIHVFGDEVFKTWMPGIKPGMTVERFVVGMTVERQCVSPVMAGPFTASHYRRHGRA